MLTDSEVTPPVPFTKGEEQFQLLLPSRLITLRYKATLAVSIEQQQASLRLFLVSLQEEQFQRKYFANVPVSVAQTAMED
jgi:single-stranded-DNA-specific exonuclease